MDAELKERMKRDALYKGTKLCVVNAIKKSHNDLGYPITKDEMMDLIAASIFEVLADVCATFDLNLKEQLKTHIASSGGEVLKNFVKSKVDDTPEDNLELLLRLLQAIKKYEENEEDDDDGEGE